MIPTEREKEFLVDSNLSCFRNTKCGDGVRIMPFTNIYDCDLAEGVFVGPFVELGGVVVGKNSRISSHSYACPGVTIGEECFIGHGCMFTNDTYADIQEYEKLSDLSGKWKLRQTIIGDRVRIGSGCCILPVKIGDGAIIGSGATVTHDVEPYTVVAGRAATLMYKIRHGFEFS